LLILKPRIKACGNLKEVQIHRHYNPLPEIQGHPGQLNQVFMNLLNNAIDAIESRCYYDPNQTISDEPNQGFIPTIEIHTLQIDDQVQIQIIDNGIGISEANQARLFQEAFTTKEIGKGTGMGLSISHQIVTQHHHGKLSCHSQINQGTTMTITLPI
jgi:two-component system, NtrC family, sensor kinase